MIRPARDTTLVSMRVEDMAVPAAGSTRRPCGHCARDVWVSPASAKAVGADAIVLCVRCFQAKERTEPGPARIANPTDEQLREIREYFKR